MEADIKAGKFLEFGEFNGNIYGTKLESIHYTVQQGKMCVLDVNPTVSPVFRSFQLFKLYMLFSLKTVSTLERKVNNEHLYNFMNTNNFALA